MTNLNLKINTESRNKKYYDKYQYCLQFYFPELSALRGKTHSSVDHALDGRLWARQVNFGGSWLMRSDIPQITDELRSDCHLLCAFFINVPNDFKLTISMDTGYFYTNHLQDITDLLNFPQVMMEQLREAVVDIPKDTIVIKNSKYLLRTYFKSQHLSNNEQKNNLKKLLLNQSNIRLSPGLDEWFTKYEFSKYIAENYFVDYNDIGIITLIRLVCPVKIKHTLNIIRDK